MLTKNLYFVQNKSLTIIYLLICWQNKFGKKFFIHTCARKGTQSHQNWTFAQGVAKNVLHTKFNLIISNVWCQIVLVPNCPVPNCLVPNCPTTLVSTVLWRRWIQKSVSQLVSEWVTRSPIELKKAATPSASIGVNAPTLKRQTRTGIHRVSRGLLSTEIKILFF